MSLLHTFKQTLKPCSTLPSSSSASSQISSTQELEPTRKPPKSSLSQQLLRLDDSYFLPSKHESKISKTQVEDSNLLPEETLKRSIKFDEENKEEDDEISIEFGRPGLNRVEFDYSGPYEPLVLSSIGVIPIIQVPASINCRLLEHQREGVKFLYNLYRNNHGGILGDDMGLGKTIQTIAFLAGVYGKDCDAAGTDTSVSDSQKGPVLIICPSSVIHNWESEFSRWASFFKVSVYHGANRDTILEKLNARGVEVLVTSFDTFRIQGPVLSEINWEIVIADEAHRLKNEKSKLYEACLKIKTKKRLGLTGTVMQNKITELFNLFEWVAPGSLGTREHFREYYDEPLKQGQRATAPERFVHIAEKRKQHLVSVLSKYMLRRTKEETIGHLMMGKEDNVVFCQMSELQKRVYQRMLQLPEIQCLVNKDKPCACGSPLKQSECCRRIVPDGPIWSYIHRDSPDGCDSCPFCLVLPCLVKLQQVSNHLELVKPNARDDADKQKKDADFVSAVFGTDIDLAGGVAASESFMDLSDVKHCGKMRALEKLMASWISKGDKILLFSYSVRMLDILEKFLIRKGYSFARLDGSTPTNLRQSLVDDFNASPSKQVFLISTRAGGLGLNLVSANRVVIFDPNWNPSHDLQAQDRSFRYGQKRHVVVFRLLAAGSLEELVYTRQVYKQQLSNIAVAGKMETRYFEGVQDCKEFQGELFGISNLFRDLSDKLFTSEIVELRKDSKKGVSDDEEEILCSSKQETQEPILGDLGIVYAHRNEDIINGGRAATSTSSQRFNVERDSNENLEYADQKKKKRKGGSEEEGICFSKRERKREKYKMLAEFKGMEIMEFSRWVLSASPFVREKILQEFSDRVKVGLGK
ncbi:PREDICTED: switch 2 isoform X1 [Brassica oleracea var. oleracea]|uniref:Switch 2 n=1 Tax=Brassica oleracea var. oleracea TaxID=109376 RepID=A0A0D3DZ49_BRAOL|nr:PREDICTED: switch 2 isoform X1 [Brassica oleracea var. oleracea]